MLSKRTIRSIRQVVVALALVFATLACAIPGQQSSPAPTADLGLQATSQALSLQATFQAAQQATLDAMAQDVAAAETQAAETAREAEAAAAEQAAEPTAAPTNTAVPEPTATEALSEPTSPPEVDIEEQIKSAKILVFEDTQPIGYWIKKSLDGAGYKYTHVGDAVGHFMEYLNSGIAWDLIIVGAESKSGVRGEFWDAINDQLNRGTALVVEIWYLDTTVNGKIKPVLTRCGINFQKDLPLAESIYWLEPTHPVFNEPNTAMPLLHYSRYWGKQAGDLISILPGSDATLLAGTFKDRPTDYGQIATCLDGTVIFQTFSNHDYPSSDIQMLWQNYVYYTLSNHFRLMNEE